MSEKFVVIATDKMSLSGLVALTEDDRFEILVPDGEEEMREALGRAHGLIVRSATKVTRELLEQAPNLRVVGRAGVGVDNIDLGVATEFGIPVINAPEGNTVSAAELAMALILTVARNVSWADASVQGGAWARSQFSGIEIRGKTLGLVGLGDIGLEVSRRARAFDMNVLYHKRVALSAEFEQMAGVRHAALAELMGESDVVSLHVPHTDATEGMIDAAALALMKSDAILINTARGGLVDETALAEALRGGRIAGAGLDAFVEEPLPVGHPLTDCPNVLLSPHVGGGTGGGQRGMIRSIVENLQRVARGDPAVGLVTMSTPEGRFET